MYLQITIYASILLLNATAVFGQDPAPTSFTRELSENTTIRRIDETGDPAGMNKVNPEIPKSTDTTETGEKNDTGNLDIGEYIMTDDLGNLIIYFDCQGRIVEKNCAEFYRKGKMDSTNLSLVGPVKDYYTNDTLALEAHLENGLLNGPAIFYHKNGKIRSKGRYLENNRTGVWTHFYDNGNLEKVINIVRGFPFIVSYQQPNGKQKVVQGNGKYTGEFLVANSCSPYEITGDVAEGKMHGKWEVYAAFNHQKVATEYYEKGKYIKTESRGETFTGEPIISINGVFPNEYLLWTENSICPAENFQRIYYKGEDVHQQFYAELLDSLNILVSDGTRDQWLIAGIQITNNSLAHSVKIKSSVSDKVTEARIYSILKSMMHFSVVGKTTNDADAHFLFTIMFTNDTVILPASVYYQEMMKTFSKFTVSGDDN